MYTSLTLEKLKEICAPMIRQKVLITGRVSLSSGELSDIYFKILRALSDPILVMVLVELLNKTIIQLNGPTGHFGGRIDGLCGIALGGALLTYAFLGKYPFYNSAVIRNDTKAHGLKSKFEFYSSCENKEIEKYYKLFGFLPSLAATKVPTNFLIIDDVITTGKSIINAAKTIRDSGFNVTDAIVVLDREANGVYECSLRGITVTSLFTKTELLNVEDS